LVLVASGCMVECIECHTTPSQCPPTGHNRRLLLCWKVRGETAASTTDTDGVLDVRRACGVMVAGALVVGSLPDIEMSRRPVRGGQSQAGLAIGRARRHNVQGG
jgi:hypothetical protein